MTNRFIVKPKSNAERQRDYKEKHRTKPKTIPLTQAQRDKRREDKQFDFNEVRLHLVYEINLHKHCLREDGFSFRYRPKKEDIYFNFDGIDTKDDYLEIFVNGGYYYEKGQQGFLNKIQDYIKKYPYVIVLDERTEDQKCFKAISKDERGSIMYRKYGKEACNIVRQCRKHPRIECTPDECNLTWEEYFNEDTKNPFKNNIYFAGIEEERLKEAEQMFGEIPLSTNDKSMLFDKECLHRSNGEISPLNEIAGFNQHVNVIPIHNNGLPVFADMSGVLC